MSLIGIEIYNYKTICLRINTYKLDIVIALSTPTNKPFNKNVNKQEYRK